MVKATRSKSKSLSVNSVVSTSAGNSMADVGDAEDSNDEAVGSNIFTGHEAHVQLQY